MASWHGENPLEFWRSQFLDKAIRLLGPTSSLPGSGSKPWRVWLHRRLGKPETSWLEMRETAALKAIDDHVSLTLVFKRHSGTSEVWKDFKGLYIIREDCMLIATYSNCVWQVEEFWQTHLSASRMVPWLQRMTSFGSTWDAHPVWHSPSLILTLALRPQT